MTTWTREFPKSVGWYWARDTFGGRRVVMLAQVSDTLETEELHAVAAHEKMVVLRGALFHCIESPGSFWRVDPQTIEFSVERIEGPP